MVPRQRAIFIVTGFATPSLFHFCEGNSGYVGGTGSQNKCFVVDKTLGVLLISVLILLLWTVLLPLDQAEREWTGRKRVRIGHLNSSAIFALIGGYGGGVLP